MVINKLAKYKSLIFLFFYTIGLAGCSSYRSDMNMSGRGQGGGQRGRAHGRGRAADNRENLQQMLDDAIRLQNFATRNQTSFVRICRIFNTLAEQNRNIIQNLERNVEGIEASYIRDDLNSARSYQAGFVRFCFIFNSLADHHRDLVQNVNRTIQEIQAYLQYYYFSQDMHNRLQAHLQCLNNIANNMRNELAELDNHADVATGHFNTYRRILNTCDYILHDTYVLIGRFNQLDQPN